MRQFEQQHAHMIFGLLAFADIDGRAEQAPLALVRARRCYAQFEPFKLAGDQHLEFDRLRFTALQCLALGRDDDIHCLGGENILIAMSDKLRGLISFRWVIDPDIF